MARARYFEVAIDTVGRPVAGVTVNVYQAGTTTPIVETIYAADTGVATLLNPLTANAQGEIEFYLDVPKRITLAWSKTGYVAESHPADVINADAFALDTDLPGAGSHPDLAAHDTLGLATQAELDAALVLVNGTYVALAVPTELNFGHVTGVDRSGVTDMTALLATAIATGRPIYVPEGDYLIEGSASPLAASPRVRGAGAGKTRFIQGSTYPVFDLAGSVGSTVALTANAAAGAITLTANAGNITSAGIVAGDYLILRSDEAWPNTDKEATYGEMVRVASVVTTTITLVAPIEDAYTTANTAVVEKITQRVGIELADFTIENDAPNTKTHAPAIQVKYARQFTARGLVLRKIDGQGIIVESTTDWLVDDCRFYDLSDNSGAQRFGYGVDARECSNDGRVSNCYMRGGRHGFTTNSNGQGANTPRGIPRHIVVSDFEVTETTNAALDTHIEGEHITFDGCRVHGVRGPGVQVRGRRVSARNIDISGTLGPGVWVRDLSTNETDLGNIRTRNNRDGTVDGLSVDGQGLRIEGSAGRVKTSGIYVESVDQDGVFIGGQGSSIHTLDDIFVRSTGATGNPNGLRFQSSTSNHRIGRLVIEFSTNGILSVGTLTNVSFDWANTVFSNVVTPLTNVLRVTAAISDAPLLRSGLYFRTVPTSSLSTSATLGNGNMRVTPFWVPRDLTLSRIGAEVTVIGDAGSKVRLGIYADDGTGYPGALVLDAGTINGDSATVQEITISQALTPGLYWIAAAVQVVTTTQPTLRVLSTNMIQTGTPSIPTAGQLWFGYLQSSVTGALPSTFTATVTQSGQVAMTFAKVA